MLRIAFLFFLCAYICFPYSCKPGTTTPCPPLSRQKLSTNNSSVFRWPNFAFNSQYVQFLILVLLLISRLLYICLSYIKRVRYIQFHVARNLLNKRSLIKSTWEPRWLPYIFILTFISFECDFSQFIILIYIFEIPENFILKVLYFRDLLPNFHSACL